MAKRKIYFDETSKITKEGKKELKRLLKNLESARMAVESFVYNPYDEDEYEWTCGTDADIVHLAKHFGVKI